MTDLKLLRQLLDLLNESDAHSIELRKWWGSTTIRVSKGALGASAGPVTYQVTAPNPGPAHPPAAAASTERGPDAGAAAPVTEPAAAPAASAAPLTEIKSPMVGTYYAQPEPGADPYVRRGSRISPGQTLCIIEAMKIMNPLDSEISGVVKEILVEDAQPVEFGQVLFRVDTNA